MQINSTWNVFKVPLKLVWVQNIHVHKKICFNIEYNNALYGVSCKRLQLRLNMFAFTSMNRKILILQIWNKMLIFFTDSMIFRFRFSNKFSHRVFINTVWPSDVIWRHRSESTLAQVVACCLTAPSHYLNQCWLIISKIQLHSSDGNFRDTAVIND